jgi:ribosomal protein L37E
MALIQCPECQLQVSDKALACPHCGYPLNRTVIQNNYKKRARRKRLPNGFGSITEIKGKNLRNPFWTRVCVGKNRIQ